MTAVIGTVKLAACPRTVGSRTAAGRGALNLNLRSPNPPVEATYTCTAALATIPPRAAAAGTGASRVRGNGEGRVVVAAREVLAEISPVWGRPRDGSARAW